MKSRKCEFRIVIAERTNLQKGSEKRKVNEKLKCRNMTGMGSFIRFPCLCSYVHWNGIELCSICCTIHNRIHYTLHLNFMYEIISLPHTHVHPNSTSFVGELQMQSYIRYPSTVWMYGWMDGWMASGSFSRCVCFYRIIFAVRVSLWKRHRAHSNVCCFRFCCVWKMK